ncbi:MAG TPA: hypothetical protein VJN01_04660 [Xanthomonadales bacterium]|nr:hypothetical protein [Xanthomonadales bacterium]
MHHWAQAEQDLASAHEQVLAEATTADACLAIAHAVLALLEILERLARTPD